MTHHHHPTYCTPAEADISNSWCRRKQYDSYARFWCKSWSSSNQLSIM